MSSPWHMLNESVLGIKDAISNQYEWFGAATLVAFTLMNSVCILAYVPQILAVARDRHGASGISCMTWILFLASHLTTIVYAIACLGSLTTALVFLGNAIACLAIILTTLIKRRRHTMHRTREALPMTQNHQTRTPMRPPLGVERGLVGK